MASSAFLISMTPRVFFILVLFTAGCNSSEVKQPIEYTGPISETEKVEFFYTVNSKLKVKMLADMMYEFKNGDKEFPKGVYLEFYTVTGTIESTLKANHAYFFKEENQWRGRGKVEVKNVAKNEQLNTEELFWKQDKERIFTDKFVTIREQKDVIWGTGLDAKQDLSDYAIKDVKGIVNVED